MRRMWIASLAVVAAASLSIAAVSNRAESINDKCPVSGEKADAKQTSGLKVGFRCANCKGKFDKEPAKYVAKIKAREKK